MRHVVDSATWWERGDVPVKYKFLSQTAYAITVSFLTLHVRAKWTFIQLYYCKRPLMISFNLDSLLKSSTISTYARSWHGTTCSTRNVGSWPRSLVTTKSFFRTLCQSSWNGYHAHCISSNSCMFAEKPKNMNVKNKSLILVLSGPWTSPRSLSSAQAGAATK